MKTITAPLTIAAIWLLVLVGLSSCGDSPTEPREEPPPPDTVIVTDTVVVHDTVAVTDTVVVTVTDTVMVPYPPLQPVMFMGDTLIFETDEAPSEDNPWHTRLFLHTHPNVEDKRFRVSAGTGNVNDYPCGLFGRERVCSSFTLHFREYGEETATLGGFLPDGTPVRDQVTVIVRPPSSTRRESPWSDLDFAAVFAFSLARSSSRRGPATGSLEGIGDPPAARPAPGNARRRSRLRFRRQIR